MLNSLSVRKKSKSIVYLFYREDGTTALFSVLGLALFATVPAIIFMAAFRALSALPLNNAFYLYFIIWE